VSVAHPAEQKVDLAADIEAFCLLLGSDARAVLGEVVIAFPIAAVGAERTLSIRSAVSTRIELGQGELAAALAGQCAREPEIDSPPVDGSRCRSGSSACAGKSLSAVEPHGLQRCADTDRVARRYAQSRQSRSASRSRRRRSNAVHRDRSGCCRRGAVDTTPPISDIQPWLAGQGGQAVQGIHALGFECGYSHGPEQLRDER